MTHRSHPPRPPFVARVGVLLLVTAGAAAPGLAQLPTTQDPQNPQSPMQPGQGLFPGFVTPGGTGDPLNSTWVVPARPLPFAGFPSAAAAGKLPGLAGFGAYPLPGGPGAAAPGGLLPGGLPIALLSPPIDDSKDWPRWLRAPGAKRLPYEPGQALLLRHTDRVWWKPPEEDVFVPLYHHDAVRSVVPGTSIEVRQTGEFEVLFHAGGRLLAQGPSQLRIAAMDDKHVEIALASFTKLRLQVSGREYKFLLPDGSSITSPADVPPATPDTPPDGPTALVLDRTSEPGWYGGRAALWNGGSRTVTWQHAYGTVSLAPGNRVLLFLKPPAAVVPAPFTAENVDVRPLADGVECHAAKDGAVVWSGARFRLPAGATLRLEPLQGRPFPAK